MTALLGRDLVLEVDRGCAQSLELAHGTDDVDSVSVACVRVCDDRQGGGVDNLSQAGEHLGHRQQPEVGHPAAPGDRAATAVEDAEPGGLGDPRREPIVYAGRDDDAVAADQFAQPRGGAHRSSARAVTGSVSRHFTTSTTPAGPPRERNLASSSGQLAGPE